MIVDTQTPDTPPQADAHEMGSAFEVDGRFTTPCSCGKRFTAATPSAANARWRKHLPARPRPADSPAPADRIRECGCGCSGALVAKAGGMFLSGHDARFKSILARAFTDGAQVRDPWTGQDADPLDVADRLDARRGQGSTFWHDKVKAGLKAPAERPAARVRRQDDGVLRGEQKATHLIQMLEERRPAPGQEGFYLRRDGRGKYPAKVLRRVNDGAVEVRVLDGPMRNQEVVIPDDRFEKIRKGH